MAMHLRRVMLNRLPVALVVAMALGGCLLTTDLVGLSGGGEGHDSDATDGDAGQDVRADVAQDSTPDGARDAAADATDGSPSAYVGRVGFASVPTVTTLVNITTSRPVNAGDALLVSLLLGNSAAAGAITITDGAGNLYAIATDVADTDGGDRSVMLYALNVAAIASGTGISINVPRASDVAATIDEFNGISAIDQKRASSATRSSQFETGAVSTTVSTELLFASVGIESGNNPVWALEWTALAPVAVVDNTLASSYRMVTTAGSYAASGTYTPLNSRSYWMAGTATFR